MDFKLSLSKPLFTSRSNSKSPDAQEHPLKFCWFELLPSCLCLLAKIRVYTQFWRNVIHIKMNKWKRTLSFNVNNKRKMALLSSNTINIVVKSGNGQPLCVWWVTIPPNMRTIFIPFKLNKEISSIYILLIHIFFYSFFIYKLNRNEGSDIFRKLGSKGRVGAIGLSLKKMDNTASHN